MRPRPAAVQPDAGQTTGVRTCDIGLGGVADHPRAIKILTGLFRSNFEYPWVWFRYARAF